MRNLYAAVATTTGARLLRNVIGLAALLCAASVPGYCDTAFLAFGGAWNSLPGGVGGNQIVINCTSTCNQTNGVGSNETLSAFQVPVATLGISGTVKDTADIGTWSISGGTETYSLSGGVVTMTISGTLTTCAGCVGTTNLAGITGNLETVTYSGLTTGPAFESPLSGTSFNAPSGNKSFALNLGSSATTVTELASLLSGLEEIANSSAVTSGGANANATSGTNTTGTHSFNSGTGSMALNVTLTGTAAPEPVTFVLFGTGLMGVALIARRRRASQN